MAVRSCTIDPSVDTLHSLEVTEQADNQEARQKPSMGFWKCWSLTVGVMIGSGIFLLPSVLAPYGGLSFLGWLFTSGGAILFALILGRLASRTNRSGGPYAYAADAFGNFVGFFVAWGYWLGVVFAITAIAVAFAGYFGAVFPVLGDTSVKQALVAAALIWILAAINVKGVSEAASIQLLMTILKLVPLAVIIALGIFVGDAGNIPEFNPQQDSIVHVIAATALLTMWAFIGMEAGVIPADDVKDPQTTIPRAVIIGTLTVSLVYILSTAAVMLLVPSEELIGSEAPFVAAAAKLGTFGAYLVAFGAMVSTAGSLNGNVFLSGQMPMSAALDGVAPKIFADRNKGHAPGFAIIFSCVLATILLIFNYNEGLIAAFTFLISMSTLGTLSAYTLSALADLKYSWKSARAWSAIAMTALAYAVIAMLGSGLEVLAWGVVLLAAGLPVYFWTKSNNKQSG